LEADQRSCRSTGFPCSVVLNDDFTTVCTGETIGVRVVRNRNTSFVFTGTLAANGRIVKNQTALAILDEAISAFDLDCRPVTDQRRMALRALNRMVAAEHNRSVHLAPSTM
jgi:hypothetical protein